MIVQSPKLSFWERIYVIEIARGMGVTLRHLVGNIFGQERMPTVQYPEQAKPLSLRHRSRHRLLVRDDGSPKCVACMCCPTACPASCIRIVAEEDALPWKEKRPKIFEIDLLRCVFCGYCVEACPEDAIRMDTDEITLSGARREDFIVGLDFLMHGTGEEWKKLRGPEGERPAPGQPAPPPETPEEEYRRLEPADRPRIPADWETPAPQSKSGPGGV
jgi:NADH-quinone oxidoreductase subunit I